MNDRGEESLIVVLGSLNSKVEDRDLNRNDIKPVQYVKEDEIHEIKFFNRIGELGVSSMQFDRVNDKLFFSTGSDLFVVDISEKEIREIDVQSLVDVHEMTIIGDSLWMANTGRNEAVKINLRSETDVERMMIGENQDSHEDKFHCNQIFQDKEMNIWGLVHHVRGRQILKVVKGKLVKSQGDGGLKSVSNSRSMDLKLNGPHSIREILDEYWIFSSGEQKIKTYDKSWNFIDEIETLGWGRGGFFSPSTGIFCAGMSPIRRRYAGIVKASQITKPVLEFINVQERESAGSIEISNIEQINNVYSIPKRVVSVLKKIG